MFEVCSSLAELNRERQRLVQEGVPPLEVNAAYNRMRKRLMEETPSFRKIPTYTGQAATVGVFLPLPILEGRGKPNEIIVTAEGVLL